MGGLCYIGKLNRGVILSYGQLKGGIGNKLDEVQGVI